MSEPLPVRIKEPSFVGPFKFLILSLVTSQSFFGLWMVLIGNDNESSAERIVIGSLTIVVLIAIVVIFCVVYYTKRKYDEMAFKRCNDHTHMH